MTAAGKGIGRVNCEVRESFSTVSFFFWFFADSGNVCQKLQQTLSDSRVQQGFREWTAEGGGPDKQAAGYTARTGSGSYPGMERFFMSFLYFFPSKNALVYSFIELGWNISEFCRLTRRNGSVRWVEGEGCRISSPGHGRFSSDHHTPESTLCIPLFNSFKPSFSESSSSKSFKIKINLDQFKKTKRKIFFHLDRFQRSSVFSSSSNSSVIIFIFLYGYGSFLAVSCHCLNLVLRRRFESERSLV